MSLIICGHNASAAFDPSIFYSAISRSFLTADCGTPCNNSTFQSLVTFRTPYTAYTILADFIVFDELQGFNTVLGLQIWQSCERLSCTNFVLAIPRIQSALCIPLPLFPSRASLGSVSSPSVPSGGPFGSTLSTHVTTQAALTDGLIIAAPQLAHRPSDNISGSFTPTASSSTLTDQPCASTFCKHDGISSAESLTGSCATVASSSSLPDELTVSLSSMQLLRASLLCNSITGIRCSAFVQDISCLTRSLLCLQ
ncbi:uncharacterized protein C8R40DRAFT_488566 [Lentinula edodes]|uniref:uncharacterized protein n=1 Tax=Lentinula edodes TaxID=5353 RepID=UPI001E8CA5F6|nr:uncharacterized protein C8R40DRAFT_488566 [Lentinula edodes]KAH7872510.1 hypothetical protein C8R40DRAFT_488566 [Lentinula edodes]